MDELSFRRNHEYVTVVVDHARRCVVWVGEGKSADTLKAFFDELGPERAAKLTREQQPQRGDDDQEGTEQPCPEPNPVAGQD